MNISDFNNRFDLAFNNAFSGFAPGIEMFHKSLFLSQAQEQIVIDVANVVEPTEQSREILRNLVINKTINYDSTLNTNLITIKLNSNSKFVEIPDEAWRVLTEHLDADIEVIPKTKDEFNVQLKNPFKKPLNNKAWRIDTSDSISATPKNIREIIYPGSFSTYTLSYLKKPSPIILEELVGDENIDGVQAQTNCKLSSIIHKDIVDKAVEYAVLAYKENTLQNNVQIK